MESRFLSILVVRCFTCIGLLVCSASILAEETEAVEEAVVAESVAVEADSSDGVVEWEKDDNIIEPEIIRRGVRESRIDHENFEVGVFAGQISLEQFGASTVTGARAAFFVTEDVFFEIAYGETEAKSLELSSELPFNLPGATIEGELDLTYYNLSIGFNLFPGEVFIGSKWAFNSALYVIGGVGSTDFVEDRRYTMNFGVGYRILFTDWLAWHVDMRNHIFEMDVVSEGRTTHNLEFHSGFTVFF